MGVDVSPNVAIGIEVDAEAFKVFEVVVQPEEFVLEDRFDPRTGQKLEPQKRITQYERKVLRFAGRDFEDENDLAHHLSKHLRCGVTESQDWMGGSWHSYVFGYHKFKSGDAYGVTPESVELAEIVNTLPKLQALQAQLQNLGITASAPRIVRTVWVS
jgi:hypothetical protein